MADVPKMSEEEICSVSFQRTIKRIRKNSAEPKNKLNIRDVHRRSAPPSCPVPHPTPRREVNELPPPKAKPANAGSLPPAQDATGGDCLLPPPPLWTSRGKAAFLRATPPHLFQSIEPLYGPAG